MPPKIDPQELPRIIADCRKGDARAFDRLFEAYRRPIYAYLARTTGDRHLAEDFLQDVFLRMIEHLDRYRESGRFDAWLFRIAANRVRDWARRKATGQYVGGMPDPDSDGGTTAVDRPVEAPPEAVLESDEAAAGLEAALATLAADEREVLVLRHYSGLSFRDIAEIMDAPLGTVLARGHRALAKLRERMTDE